MYKSFNSLRNLKWMKIKRIYFLFIGFTFIIVVNMTYTVYYLTSYKDVSENIIDNKPNTSSYFELTPFRIPQDYTWAQAAMQPWCSGAGTENNPYIISSVKIDAQNQNIWCLFIESTSVFFQIKNSLFYNSESGGIRLYHVQNGEILNNTCNDNHYGILVGSSNNILMENNYVDGNYYGVGIYSTSYSDLLHSTILNSYTGIDFMNSDNNVISACEIRYNSYGGGLYMYESFNNEITFNSFSYNDPAIHLTRCDSNTFDQNTLISNENAAIQFFQSSYNIFTKNTIRDHSTAILLTSQSNENTFLENMLIDNNVCIKDSGEGNVFRDNFCGSTLTIIIIISSITIFISTLIIVALVALVVIAKKRKKKKQMKFVDTATRTAETNGSN